MPRNEFQAEIIPYEPDAVNADEGIVIIQDISHQDQTFDKHIFRSSLKAASIIVLSLKKSVMKISVNNKETELLDGNTIAQLAIQLELPAQGVAVAVNNKMIPRKEWETYAIQEGDNLTIIKAACGG